MASLAEILAARREFVRSRTKPKQPTPQAYPRRSLLQYTKYMLDRWRLKNRLIRDELFPQLRLLLEQAALDEAGGFRKDAVSDDIIRVFGSLRLLFANDYPEERTEVEVTQVSTTTDEHSSKEHQKQIKRSLGLELIVPEPGVGEALRGFTQENLDLVSTLDADDFASMQTIVRRGISQGLRVGDIERELIARLGISKNRAKLIAVDQTNKLFGKLTKLRQESVGVTEYIWNTSEDERVRPRHAELHDTKQSWKKAAYRRYQERSQSTPGRGLSVSVPSPPGVS